MERCLSHGSEMTTPMDCDTQYVLKLVAAERARQFERYGTNEENPNGTGPNVPWLMPFSVRGATQIEEGFRKDYERTEAAALDSRSGPVSWVQLLREELAEVAMEADPQKLIGELIQLAALSVSWVENLRREERVTRSSELPDSGA